MLWSTWLLYVNGPVPQVQYYSLIEYRRKITVSAGVFSSVSENSGGLLLFHYPDLCPSALSSDSPFLHRISYSYPRCWQRNGGSSASQMSMGGDEHPFSGDSHAFLSLDKAIKNETSSLVTEKSDETYVHSR
ncbi:hypothetical protein EVAR_84882_1 [Eumeta japonica]|uniref:Uncharacterized protein n=1 Tax=Eumeta variegata TaxID=151549 RepID=A0A4C1YER9_EUMVA|nr:hypothetical protein EVAR_84882_1 [Eumeta japonica]